MEKETKKQRVVLCPVCGACPEIVFDGQEVLIGEKDNLVRLKKTEWNDLVRKIRKGELTEIG